VQDVFGTVVIAVAAIGAVVALITLVGSGRSYRQIGHSGLLREGDDGAPDGPAAEREEIRQMLGARNARRERRGEPPLDVDAEVERRIRKLT
jgi:hypothetical protein